jgi:glycosyltransferase involved in cell wall biosynthesis
VIERESGTDSDEVALPLQIAPVGPPVGLRVVVVQTIPRINAEVTVLHTLLSALDRGCTPHHVQVLLLQGVDDWHPGGDQAAEAFAEFECVRVERFQIGGLGRDAGSRAAQARKVVDLGRLGIVQRRLLRVVQQFEPHLLYSAQQRWDQRLAVRLAGLTGLPRVVHLHYTVGPWLGPGSVQALLTADKVLAVSDFIRQDAIAAGVAADRVHTVHNPVPSAAADGAVGDRTGWRDELGIPVDARVVGMVGRICESKCQSELLAAVLPLLQGDKSVHLVLAGAEYPPGNGATELLRHRAAQAGVESQLHLLGHRADVPAVLDGLDVFAHPSRSEPFALAILEAMARGLPVVAWHEGGTIEQVLNQETGILVPPMDIHALTRAIEDLLADPLRRKDMGDAGRERVRTAFGTDVAARTFVEELTAVAKSPERAREPLGPS